MSDTKSFDWGMVAGMVLIIAANAGNWLITPMRHPDAGPIRQSLAIDDAVVRPNGSAHPLPLLDDVRVCLLDELAHFAESFPAPVPELGDSLRDELGCRLALARARLFHVRILVAVQALAGVACTRRQKK